MENRNFKVIAIAALVVAVIGVSVGFAAFTRTLTIKTSAAVNPEDNFDVVFSKSDSEVVDGTVAASTLTPNTITAEPATINNAASGGPEITNLKATFTAPGQSATYTFYAYNDSEYTGYLKSITFTPAGTKCSIPTGSQATSALVNDACPDISVKISVGSDTNTQEKTTTTAVSSHSLAAGAAELVTVVISYDQRTGQTLADGAFDVDLGTIQLLYSTVDA